MYFTLDSVNNALSENRTLFFFFCLTLALESGL